MKTIRTERSDGVLVVKLDRGVTNALDLHVCRELAETLRKARDDADVHSLVLCSSNDTFFSIGFDIPQLFELPKADFRVFYHTFNGMCMTMYTFPKPTLAAVTGHAVAGGCILALCCDYRFIAEGRKLMGLNEIKLGVPVPYPGDCILRHLVGARHARDIVDSGEFYEPRELVEMGLVDRVLPVRQVLTTSIEEATRLGALPRHAFWIMKQNRVERVEEEIRRHQAEKEAYFIDCWYADETRERLKQAMEKF